MVENTQIDSEAAVTVAETGGPSSSSAVVATETPPVSESPQTKEGGGTAEVAAPSETPPSDFAKKRLQQRIDKLTARNKALEASLVASQQGGKAPSTQDEAAIARLVEERAEVLAEERANAKVASRSYDNDANAVVTAGKSQFGEKEFMERVERLKEIRDPEDVEEIKQYSRLIGALMKTGEAPRLIHALGDDLETASRLMRLDGFELGLEVAKFAAKEPPASVTGAPKPITPVGNRGRNHEPLKAEAAEGDRLTTAEWMRRRVGHVDQVNKDSGRRLL
jgi:hypothetical protein